MTSFLFRLWVLGGYLLALSAGATAQSASAPSYTCRDNTGRVFISPRPCPDSGVVIYGPTERELDIINRRNALTSAQMGKAPDHIALMSPRCASLHDAMRTAHSRGISPSTQMDMRNEYNRECREEESRAFRKLAEQGMEKREQARESERQQQAASNQAKASAELCGELKRVIKTRKARTDLTDGEKRDLERTEQNYLARCQ